MPKRKTKARFSGHRIGFPSFHHYNIPVKYFLEQAMDTECVMPEPPTKETIRIGELNSPDYVCAPFKHLIGSMIELLDAGADVLIMVGGPCRLGFFGELQEKILKDQGYEFDLVNLSEAENAKVRDILKLLRGVNPKFNILKMLLYLPSSLKMVRYLDEIDEIYDRNMGFETEKGAYEKAVREFKEDLLHATRCRDVKRAYKKVKAAMDAVPLNKPEDPLRVGIVGEYFTIIDKHGNMEIEDRLCRMGIEVSRYMNFTHSSLEDCENKLLPDAADYMQYYMGPTSASTVAMAENYAKQGYDGIIHVKSFGCTPEVDCVPLLQRVSSDYKIPILYLSYDTQTGDAGLETRLEAFHDMIAEKKKVSKRQ